MSSYDEREASTWGPRHAVELLGHASAESVLLAAFNSGRMPHAWLIAGPKGIGKATLAFRFARFVLAQGESGRSMFDGPATSLQVSAENPIFARTASLGHADLLVIERAWDERGGRWRSEVTVDEVRRINAFYAMTAAEGGYRICVVDAADEMNANAANALLKVLEEPPPRSLLLLVAHAPGRLLPTIRSRCRTLRLQALSDTDVRSILRSLLPEQSDADLAALTHLAEGCPGRAAALAEQGGLELYRSVIGLLASLPQLDIVGLHAFGDRLARGGPGAFRVFGDLLGWWLARLVRAATGPGADEVVADEGALMRHLWACRGLDQWIEVWENVTRLVARADDLSLDRKQVVLSVFSALERAARP